MDLHPKISIVTTISYSRGLIAMKKIVFWKEKLSRQIKTTSSVQPVVISSFTRKYTKKPSTQTSSSTPKQKILKSLWSFHCFSDHRMLEGFDLCLNSIVCWFLLTRIISLLFINERRYSRQDIQWIHQAHFWVWSSSRRSRQLDYHKRGSRAKRIGLCTLLAQTRKW